jgi:hypothetical protein
MHEASDCPHGEVIAHIMTCIIRQLGVSTPGAGMAFKSDNGIIKRAVGLDVLLENMSKNDQMPLFRLINRCLLTPPPVRMKFLPNGKTYPNIVVEVAGRNEYLKEITDDISPQ